MRLVTPDKFMDIPLKLKETNLSTKLNRIKIPTGGRQISWLFTNMTEELNRVYRETALAKCTSGFRVRRSNH